MKRKGMVENTSLEDLVTTKGHLSYCHNMMPTNLLLDRLEVDECVEDDPACPWTLIRLLGPNHINDPLPMLRSGRCIHHDYFQSWTTILCIGNIGMVQNLYVVMSSPITYEILQWREFDP